MTQKWLKCIIIVMIAFGNLGLFCGSKQLALWRSLLKSDSNFVKNKKWRKQRNLLKRDQNPPVIVLSCSDSRVPPEIIFQQGLGKFFTVRVAGEVADDVVIDSIEYAVGHYDSFIIVVMGHSRCGAVSGALDRLRATGGVVDTPGTGHIDAVLVPIEVAIVEAGIDIYGPNALNLSVQANVRYVANKLVSESSDIRAALAAGTLNIIGAEYYLDTGKVEQLFIIE